MDFLSEFTNLQKLLEEDSPELESESFLELVPDLLDVLGHPDGKIRDDLGWTTLSRYFSSDSIHPGNRIPLIELLITDEFLFYKINEGVTDDSPRRSFSALSIADLIWGDADHGPAMDRQFISKIMGKVRMLLVKDKDHRGFVEGGLGWVHTSSHIGDCLNALVAHRNADSDEILTCVTTILEYVEGRGNDVFKWDEHQRLSRPVTQAIACLSSQDNLLEVFSRYTPEFMSTAPSRHNLANMIRRTQSALKEAGYKNDALESIFNDITK
jgi:hypothetical protein